MIYVIFNKDTKQHLLITNTPVSNDEVLVKEYDRPGELHNFMYHGTYDDGYLIDLQSEEGHEYIRNINEKSVKDVIRENELERDTIDRISNKHGYNVFYQLRHIMKCLVELDTGSDEFAALKRMSAVIEAECAHLNKKKESYKSDPHVIYISKDDDIFS